MAVGKPPDTRARSHTKALKWGPGSLFGGYGVRTKEDYNNLSRQIRETGSVWTGRETSFSGADIRVYVNIYSGTMKEATIKLLESKLEQFQSKGQDEQGPNNNEEIGFLQKQIDSLGRNTPAYLELGTLQTLSFSIHRDKFPVRALGHVAPKGHVRGSRTIAGTMIFTVFNQHVLATLLTADAYYYEGYPNNIYELPDQLPPVDLTLIAINEYGYKARMLLLGVEFVNEGTTFSTEDLITETQMQYTAKDMDPLRPLVEDSDVSNRNPRPRFAISGSSLLGSEDYLKYRRRQNPFI